MFDSITNPQNEKLEAAFHPAQGDTQSKRVVVIGHGVTGNMSRPFVLALAEGLAAAGIHALRFSFAGNGGSEGRFVDSTITKEVADLGAVLDAVEAKGYEIAYAGHSMGGAVGVIRAAKDPRIRRLISLAGMVHTKAFAQREFGMVTPDQGCMWDDEACPLSQAYMDDLARIGSVESLGSRIGVPWLLVHGTEDDVVPLQDSKDIMASAGRNAELVELAGANHVFADAACARMVAAVTGWLKKQ